MRKLLIAALLMMPIAAQAQDRAKSIVFIGNSFTFGAGSAAHRYQSDTVTDLMLIFGISNFGRYAHYYKEIYGCPPSATLRKFSDSGVLIN